MFSLRSAFVAAATAFLLASNPAGAAEPLCGGGKCDCPHCQGQKKKKPSKKAPPPKSGGKKKQPH
ncbi:MAG TPA: hypothetical protein PKA88_09225 [Polyangiaceae bacterium]|nr:hypothetical protein [Polyangiaceae bacterium]HMR74659.1 hypothetical protein [Polyangiaceae bacterium]